MLDVDAGLGPLYMETAEAIQNLAEAYKDDPKAFKKKMKELESEAWEDFLDMTVSQASSGPLTTSTPREPL
jgi:adenylylsulfate reductase subunit A